MNILVEIQKELQMQILKTVRIKDVEVTRTLSVLINPNRYRSRASEAFTKEILPQFSPCWDYLEIEKIYLIVQGVSGSQVY